MTDNNLLRKTLARRPETRRRRTDWNTVGAAIILLLFVVGLPLGCYLHMEAVEWDWRCLFVECRIDK